jgi:uncharacterized RDD family membrane protein YckC
MKAANIDVYAADRCANSMFTILGGDGQEYGPASTQQIRSWIAAGRANLDTKAKIEGSDEWLRLGDYAEFTPPSALPPVIAANGTAVDPDALVAERWRRLVGAVIDGIVESICWIPTSLALMKSFSEMMESGSMNPTAFAQQAQSLIPLSLPYLGALVILQATLLSLKSQSIGNLLVRTRIVRMTDGAPGGFLRAFLLRGFLARVLRHIPVLGGVFWIVDSCFIFRPDKRCLHDLMAGTKVVKVLTPAEQEQVPTSVSGGLHG